MKRSKISHSVYMRQFAPIVGALFILAACSSQKETLQKNPEPIASDVRTVDAAVSHEPGEPFLARPDMDIVLTGEIPQVDLAKREAILDRARLHIVLASKALQHKDTLTTIAECELAGNRLDAASRLPGIEDNPAFLDLSSRLIAMHRLCTEVIERSDVLVEALTTHARPLLEDRYLPPAVRTRLGV